MKPSSSDHPRLARRLFIASTVIVLVACGGGGGGGASPSPAPNPAPPPAPPPAPVVVAPMVAAGNGFSLALRSNGTVSSWGDQGVGQLGNNVISANSQRNPQSVVGLASARQVAAGQFHAVALRTDGTVVAWGSNSEGRLGIGSVGGLFPTPQVIGGLSNVTAVAVGADHTLALRGDGTVWAWGMNDVGQLGQTPGQPRAAPTQVPGLTGVTAIAAGGAHSLAIRSDGSVWAWGWNENGQLGLGAGGATVVSTPTRIAALDGRNVAEIVAGGFHSLARTSLGTVFGWGSNANGQAGAAILGASVPTPAQISGLSNVSALAAGERHSLARLADGTARAWGHAGSGRLGNGSTGATQSTSVPQVVSTANVVAIAAGQNHSLAVLTDGRVMCFGSNFLSQCGVPGTNLEFATPTEVGPGFRTHP